MVSSSRYHLKMFLQLQYEYLAWISWWDILWAGEWAISISIYLMLACYATISTTHHHLEPPKEEREGGEKLKTRTKWTRLKIETSYTWKLINIISSVIFYWKFVSNIITMTTTRIFLDCIMLAAKNMKTIPRGAYKEGGKNRLGYSTYSLGKKWRVSLASHSLLLLLPSGSSGSFVFPIGRRRRRSLEALIFSFWMKGFLLFSSLEL